MYIVQKTDTTIFFIEDNSSPIMRSQQMGVGSI
jgi:hypothetical protein